MLGMRQATAELHREFAEVVEQLEGGAREYLASETQHLEVPSCTWVVRACREKRVWNECDRGRGNVA